MNPLELEEFRYNYGDKRPVLLKYIESEIPHENWGTIIKSKELIKNLKSIPSYKCGPDKKRLFTIDDKFKNIKKPIIVLPIVIISKENCTIKPNTKKHLNYVVYNRNTHEFIRIDMKKYFIKGFSVKVFFKKTNVVIKNIIKEFDPEISKLKELDTNEHFMKDSTLNDDTKHPIYSLIFIDTMLRHPLLKMNEIEDKILNMSNNKLQQIWSRYKEISKSLALDNCKDSQIYSLESSHCLNIDGNQYNNLIDKKTKECADSKVYNPLTSRCSSKIKELDFMFDNLKDVKFDKNVMLKTLGSNASVIPSMAFVLSRRKNGIIIGANSQNLKSKKTWTALWTAKTEKLTIPPGFRKQWIDAINNKEIRFIIILISLYEPNGGIHANCIIYDKLANEFERFDGLGNNLNEAYKIQLLDKELMKRMTKVLGKYMPKDAKYYLPIDYCPRKKAVFQRKEMDEFFINDERGSCAIWRLFYIDVRLGNPSLDRKQVMKYANKLIESDYKSYQRFIKTYQKYILDNITIA